MQNHSHVTTRLLRLVSAVAFLAALAACDNDRVTDDRNAPADEADTILSDDGENAGERQITDPETRREDTSDADAGSVERPGDPVMNEKRVAVAEISPTVHGEATGTVTFIQREDAEEVEVSIELAGLKPGRHGFHIHENGDCSAEDASSAGGHFSPDDEPHGDPDEEHHHAGDAGNIEADEDGRVSSELKLDDIAFSGENSIINRAVVIHEGADDLESQPAGDSGDRVGCGVIRKG